MARRSGPELANFRAIGDRRLEQRPEGIPKIGEEARYVSEGIQRLTQAAQGWTTLISIGLSEAVSS